MTAGQANRAAKVFIIDHPILTPGDCYESYIVRSGSRVGGKWSELQRYLQLSICLCGSTFAVQF